MKNILLFMFATYILTANLCAQDIESKKVTLELGYSYLSNFFNGNDFYSYKHNNLLNTYDESMSGASFNIVRETKYKWVDILVGVQFNSRNTTVGLQSYRPGFTNSYDYSLNGGGVYVGIRPSYKTEHFGLTSDFSLGLFTYKEYIGIYNNQVQPFVDVFDRKASSGLGAKFSLGFYLKVWKIGIHPTADLLFSGGAGSSFMFYGTTLPLTFTF